MNTLTNLRTPHTMTVVVVDTDDRGQFAKYDRFASKAIPKRGKFAAAYGAIKFGAKVVTKWSKTPAGRRAILRYASRSKYTKYGTVAVSGGLIFNAIQSPTDQQPEARTKFFKLSKRGKYYRKHKLGKRCRPCRR